MPVQRVAISTNQLAELLGVEAKRFRGLEPDPCFRDAQRRDRDRWWIVLEPSEDEMQTSKTMPQLNSGGKKIGTKKGGRKGC